MAVTKVKKIAVFGTDDKKEEILVELQKRGLLHIIEKKEKDLAKTKDEISTLIYQTDIILGILEKKVKIGLFESLKPVYVSENDFFKKQKEDYEINKEFIHEIWDKIKQKEELESSIEEKKALLTELLPWKNINFSINDLRSNHYTDFILGKIPVRFFENSKDSIYPGAEIDALYQDNESVYTASIVFKNEKDAFLDEVKKIGFEEYIPSSLGKSIAVEYEEIRSEIEKKTNVIKILEQDMNIYTQFIQRIKLFSDYIETEREKIKAEKMVEKGDYTFHCFAWIAEKNLKYMDRFVDHFKFMDYDVVEPEKGEVSPVFLENGSFGEAFEFITDMFGYPKEKEPDPTMFLAPFFALFFAICLTDAGYGLLIGLTSLFALKKFHFDDSMKKLLKIMTLSGFTTVVVGFLAGGFFGITADVVAKDSFVMKLIDKLKLFDAAQDKELFLGISLGLGFLHVFVGFLISFVYKLKGGMKKQGFLDVLPWIFIMIGVGMIVLSMLLKVESSLLKNIGIIVSLTGAGVILLFAGRESKNPVIRFFNGLYGLYGVTGVFGDILSYARLFALGLATGIIGGVVNTLASGFITTMSFTSIGTAISSVLWIIAFIVLIVFGHIFNLTINALGAFIHTMRLQFVEFFGKFFEGGGELFTPFRLRLKYFSIKGKENKEEI
ncbi:MAG: hypothetical protein A2Y41_00550 [Spirochaetes bacterium GWB1_36_13]|nr:MAG: hypothetical protein A2Y41_00550 [Spirochaetes bacterium GWB1_36_13]